MSIFKLVTDTIEGAAQASTGCAKVAVGVATGDLVREGCITKSDSQNLAEGCPPSAPLGHLS